MVFKKSFKLLVATGTTPFFTVVSIIFEQDISDIYLRWHGNPPTNHPHVTSSRDIVQIVAH